jgi:hypothetical protein
MRKLIDVPRVSFESMMRKRARASLAKLRGSGAAGLAQMRLKM